MTTHARRIVLAEAAWENHSEQNVNVAFFIFNRPDTTQRVFEAIAAAQPERLLVVADGARADRQGEADLVAQTRAIIDQVNWPCVVDTNFATENLGCKPRVSSGLQWVFEKVEDAIVLEDDCLPDPSFFNYCTQLLERYRDDDRVAAISGDNFQNKISRTTDSYYFSKYFHCWGWASWRRVVQQVDFEMESWPEFDQRDGLHDWSDSEAELNYWQNLFSLQHAGEINSWAYPFFYSCWERAGLTILPDVNLVSNIGFDQDATHTTSAESDLSNLPTYNIGELKHPNVVQRHQTADAYTFENVFKPETAQPTGAKKKKSLFRSLKRLIRPSRG